MKRWLALGLALLSSAVFGQGAELPYNPGTLGPISANSILCNPTSSVAVPIPCASTIGSGVSVLDKGAVGDGTTDDWPAFQAAIEQQSAAGGGLVIIPPTATNTYRIAQALRMRSNVTVQVVAPSTTIKCTGNANYNDAYGGVAPLTGRFPFTACVMFGSVIATSQSVITPVPLSNITIGNPTVTATTPADIAAYVAGDLIDIESTTSYAGFNGDYQPSVSMLNLVTAVNAGTGVLTLLYPMDQTITGAQIKKITNNGVQAQSAPGGNSGVPYWGSYNAKLIGGTWNALKQFDDNGGALDCKIDVNTINAQDTLFSQNLLTGCTLRVQSATAGGKLVELAWQSAHTSVSITEVAYVAGGTHFGNMVWFGEGDHHNKVDIESLRIGATGGINAVYVNRTNDNNVHIHDLSGLAITGSTVNISAGVPFSGAIYPGTANNTVQIDHSNLASQTYYINLGTADTTNNVVKDSQFYGTYTGTTTTSVTVYQPGANNKISRVYIDQGRLLCDATNGVSSIENSFIADGIRSAGSCLLDNVSSTSVFDQVFATGRAFDTGGHLIGNPAGSTLYLGSDTANVYNGLCVVPGTTGNSAQLNGCGVDATKVLTVQAAGAAGVNLGNTTNGVSLATGDCAGPCANYLIVKGSIAGSGGITLTTAGSDTFGNGLSLSLATKNASAAGSGGAINLNAGDGNSSGVGGAILGTAGNGGSTAAGGQVSWLGGPGGATGAGGTISNVGGKGGATSGNGGGVGYTGGAAGDTTAGNGGSASLLGGAAGVTSGTGTGGAVNITSGAGGATSGNSGVVAIKGGAVTSGTVGAVNIQANTNGITNVGTGTTNANVNVGNGANLTVLGPTEIVTGTAFTAATATGCGTTNGTPGTISGGPQGGSFVGNSSGTNCTVVITINGATGKTAAHGWACYASDITSAVALAQSATSTTTCTIKGTLNATSDTVVFQAMGY